MIDQELADYCQKLKDDNTLTWENRFDKLIEFKKKYRGLVGMSNPFTIPVLEGNTNKEKLCKDFFIIEEAIALGKIENSELQDHKQSDVGNNNVINEIKKLRQEIAEFKETMLMCYNNIMNKRN